MVDADLGIDAVMLDRNDLNQLQGFEFVNAGLAHIRKLTMKNCKLESFQENLFSGLTNLHHLDLSHNSLTLLHPHQLSSLPALKRLDLSHNRLYNIHKNAFYNLGPSLERLDLKGNALTSISWMTFIDLPHLKHPQLASNPWHCDCKIGQLFTELTQRNIVPSQASCSSPLSLSNRQWSSLHTSDFSCPPVVSLPHQQSVRSGQVVPLHCQVTGNPTPTVTWRLAGHTIPQTSDLCTIRQTKSGDGHSTSVFSILTIRNISSSSIGLYTCMAKNIAGVDEKELSLSFIDFNDVLVESDESPVNLIIAISASTAIIVILTLLLILLCCVRKFKAIKTSGLSNSFTILQYSDKGPAKDREKLKQAWTNPMPKPPRTGAYNTISYEDMPRTLSRSSTGQTYLLADTYDGDTSHVSGDGYNDATLPRVETDWTRYAATAPLGAYKYSSDHLDSPDMFTLISNRPGSRASLGTISTIDPVYAAIKHSHTHPLYPFPPHHQAVLSPSCHTRPGYVTLPRRPKQSHYRSLSTGDCLGPRTSADGCSHTNISTLPRNSSTNMSTLPMNNHTNMSTLPMNNHTNISTNHMARYCQATIELPPYSPPPPVSITAINTVGLPPVQVSLHDEDTPTRTSTPKTAPSPSPPPSRAQLDTIPEQE